MATLSPNAKSVLARLKLSSVTKPTKQPAVQMRRNKLSNLLWEQIQLATAQETGDTYAPLRTRTIKDKLTGQRHTVELAKRSKPWWFASEDGTLCLQVRYGVKVLEIIKDKNTITIADKSDLVPTLKLVKQAVEEGELDKVLEAHASKSRLNFAK